MNSISFKSVNKSFVHWDSRPDSVKKVLIDLLKGSFTKGSIKRVSVLENINFDIKAGEFVGIMGRNGAGKSTILKLISGIYRPDSGEVRVNGSVAPLLALGAGFSEDLTGYENIFLNGSILGFGKKEIKKSLEQIIYFSELNEKIDMPIKNYSSGMLVRLAFSIAAHLDAPILLFDEVLAVGDLGFQNKCLNKISRLHKEGRTVILVTHSPEQINNHCTRAILIDNKTLAYDGPADGAAKIYQNWFV